MAPSKGSSSETDILWIERLQQRHERDASGLYYVEGMRQVLCALKAGLPLERLVYSEILAPAMMQKQVRLARRDGVAVLRVSPEQFRRLSVATHASGIGAVIRQKWTRIEEADPAAGLCWVAIGGSRSPGNVGTMMRAAEAAGAAGVIIFDKATDPLDQPVIRASMGGIFGLRLVRATLPELLLWVRRHRCRIVGMSPGGEISYSSIPIDSPLVLMFGEERKGLNQKELAVCWQTARIPMVGDADSLNVGVAAGVVLFDLLRRRTECQEYADRCGVS